MGLDIVELVMRVEEEFDIQIADSDAGGMKTVGDLYRIILDKHKLPNQSSKEIERNPPLHISKYPPWTTSGIWVHLKWLIADQLQIDPGEVREDSSFSDDLGTD